MSKILLRCRKCRSQLNDSGSDSIISSHNEPLKTNNLTFGEACPQSTNDMFFVKESSMPKWISDSVNEANWCKGKLTCPNCSARLGSFDFVTGTKCGCDKYMLPPIHLVKSKLDYNIV